MPENNEGKRNPSSGRIKLMFETMLENKRKNKDKQSKEEERMYVKRQSVVWKSVKRENQENTRLRE